MEHKIFSCLGGWMYHEWFLNVMFLSALLGVAGTPRWVLWLLALKECLQGWHFAVRDKKKKSSSKAFCFFLSCYTDVLANPVFPGERSGSVLSWDLKMHTEDQEGVDVVPWKDFPNQTTLDRDTTLNSPLLIRIILNNCSWCQDNGKKKDLPMEHLSLTTISAAPSLIISWRRIS